MAQVTSGNTCVHLVAEGFRGMLPVRAGDLTLTTGTWHCHFDHKTQKPGRIWSDKRGDLLSYYPATSAASVSLLDRFELPRDHKVFGRDRACMTFRRIENHCNQCIYAWTGIYPDHAHCWLGGIYCDGPCVLTEYHDRPCALIGRRNTLLCTCAPKKYIVLT